MSVCDENDDHWDESYRPTKRQKTSTTPSVFRDADVSGTVKQSVRAREFCVSPVELPPKSKRQKRRIHIPKIGGKSSDNYFPRTSKQETLLPKLHCKNLEDATNNPSSQSRCYTGVGRSRVPKFHSTNSLFRDSESDDEGSYFMTQQQGHKEAEDKRKSEAVHDIATAENPADSDAGNCNAIDPSSCPITSSYGSQLNPARLGSIRKDDPQSDSAGCTAKLTVQRVNNFDLETQLADLPSDAFASSPPSPVEALANHHNQPIGPSPQVAAAITHTSGTNDMRQLTLFGDTLDKSRVQRQPDALQSHWPPINRDEKPTHHVLNNENLHSWVYPTNLGVVRDYQFNIISRGLFHNLLVALPTGLGKTFIAATIMLNWLRWTKSAQIIFVAPTKPLVAQQVDACLGITGISKSQTALLTGGVPPGLRAEAWANKRVFFLTPQTIMNDLKTGICDPKRIVLLVVDEAHRATGAYAYVELIKFLRRFNESFRVLALTATPGSSVEAVQAVIDGLSISRVEIRTESSLDIRQYIHARRSDVMLLDNSAEMEHIMELFSNALRPVVNRLCQLNAYYFRDPMRLTAYGLTQARQRWMSSDAGRNANMALKAMVNNIFTILASLAHGIDLLKYHGLVPFYHNVLAFRTQHSSGNGKTAKEIIDSADFKQMLSKLQICAQDPNFVGHPKLETLQQIVVNHFLDAGEGRCTDGAQASAIRTRVMIFAQFRDSAEEIVRVLWRNSPNIRPHVFIGQAAGKRSEGMDQKRQLEILKDFKSGKYNTLVATSIGEEGLDIGEIDLIICYDSSASPIRMLQRAGRTGRKRAGRIILLLMNGKEADSFSQAKDNYEKMQAMIASGKRFRFHDEQSPRILPKEAQPEVDKHNVEIPVENQGGCLPEPKSRRKVPKKPPKKFHMPEGVKAGFVKASGINEDSVDLTKGPLWKVKPGRVAEKAPREEPIPSINDVILTPSAETEFTRRYLNVPGDSSFMVYPPSLVAFPEKQRHLRETVVIGHGNRTRSVVKTLRSMFEVNLTQLDGCNRFRRKSLSAQIEQLCGPDCSISARPSPMSNESKRLSLLVKHDVQQALQRPTASGGQFAKTIMRKPQRKDLHDEAALDGISSSPPTSHVMMQLRSQGISLGSSDTSGAEQDDEAYDSELADFVVGDEDLVSSQATSSSLLDSDMVPL